MYKGAFNAADKIINHVTTETTTERGGKTTETTTEKIIRLMRENPQITNNELATTSE